MSILLGIRYADAAKHGQQAAVPIWAWLILTMLLIVLVVAVVVPMVWLFKRFLDWVEKPSIELIRQAIDCRGGVVLKVEQQLYDWGPFAKTLTGIVFRATYLEDGVQRQLWVKVMGPRFGKRHCDWSWDYGEPAANTAMAD